MTTEWALKIIALLHDPPDKILGLKGHQQRSMELLNRLLGEARFRELFGEDASVLVTLDDNALASRLEGVKLWQDVKAADHVATAMDRASFANDDRVRVRSAEYAQRPVVRHPLSGRLFSFASMNQAQAETDVKNAHATLDGFLTQLATEELRYLWVWRRLRAEIGRNLHGGLKDLWLLLPADTRICDHALEQHLDATAAVVSALPQPALVVFNLGGAQDFIATARRTQDLWMGSYILSYLAWQGMRLIAEEFGPDAVLYPSLREQPLVDHWLRMERKVQIPGRLDLRMATLPNKFVVLLPSAQVEPVAAEVKKKIADEWERLTESVRDGLAALLDEVQTSGQKVRDDNKWKKMWEQHCVQFPQVYWCAHVWPDTSRFSKEEQYKAAEEALKEIKELLDPPPSWAFWEIFRLYLNTDKKKKVVNLGTVYGPLHHLAQRALDARKALRDFVPINEEGPKCSVCGVRAAIRTSTIKAEDKDGLWSRISERLREVDDKEEKKRTPIEQRFSGHYAAIKPEGRERLCGVCATKRFVQPAAFNKEMKDRVGLERGFPSTSTIAAATFVTALFRELKRPDPRLAELKDALTAFVQALKDMRLPETAAERAIPLNSDLAGQVTGDIKWATGHLIKYDSDFLFPETYTIERLRDDYAFSLSEGKIKGLREKLGRLLKAADALNIRRPAKYYAILALAGDQMGRWVSGALAPRFAQTLHPFAAERLAHFRENDADWSKWLSYQRVFSPALHTSISRALANFALHCVKWVVEECYPGRVVYAGGDDVLALLPVDCALAAARELRALFSGEALRQDDDLQVTFADPDRSGYLKWEGNWMLTMGPTATASVGIAIAHHLQPLDTAIEAARRAEQSAKEDYNRNAIAVHFLRRSGEELRIGARFFYGSPDDPSRPPLDTLYWVDEVRQRMVNDCLSSKLAHDFLEQARGLDEAPEEAVEAILRRALKRHKGEQLDAQQATEQANELGPRLAQLATVLDKRRRDWKSKQYEKEEEGRPSSLEKEAAKENEPPSGVSELAHWLLLARFLAQEGGEE